MNTINYTEKFNSIFNEFIDDIVETYPDDTSMHLYKFAISGAMMMNQNMIMQGFNTHVVIPFGEQLLNKEESFFLNHDYKDIAGINTAMDFIERLKGYWVEMPQNNRDIIWKYFRILILICNKVYL